MSENETVAKPDLNMAETPLDAQEAQAKEKARKQRSLRPIAMLGPFVWRYKPRLFMAVFMLLAAAAASLSLPALVRNVIDEGFIEKNFEFVGHFAPLIMIVAVLMAIATAARFYFVMSLGERVVTDVRMEVFNHLLRLDANFFDSNRTGELISRLTADTTLIRAAVGSSASMALRSSVMLVGAIVMMMITLPAFAAMVLGAMVVTVLPLVFFGRRVRKLARKTQDSVADLAALATESLSAVKTVQAYTREREEMRRYQVFAEDSYIASVRRLFARSTLMAVVIILMFFAIVALVGFGSFAVREGTVSIGALTQFLLYSVVAAMSLGTISEVWGELQSLAGATERIAELLETEADIQAPANPTALPVPALGTVVFKQAHFAYPSRPNDLILNGINFDISAGESVAIVGASGAGKSTLFALLQRFYDVNQGQVLVDGLDLRDMDPVALRARFAYVEQETVIFSGTIADNIRFGAPNASDAEMVEAAKAAFVDEFVEKLEDGYQTVVGERGVMLSGGQKQRISIARALLKDAPILLLDEATSALDAQSEKKVQMALERLMQGRTTLIIAHRLATIQNADRILVMESGQVVDQGTHAELSQKGGLYAKLAKLQFG